MRILLIILVFFTNNSNTVAQRKLDLVTQIIHFELKGSNSNLSVERFKLSKGKSFEDRVILDLSCAKALMERAEIKESFDLIYKYDNPELKQDDYLYASYLLVKARLSYKLGKLYQAAFETGEAYKLFKENAWFEESKLAAINEAFYKTRLKHKDALVWFYRAKNLSSETRENEILLYSNWAFYELFVNKDISAGEQLMVEFDKRARSFKKMNYQDQHRRLIILAIIEEMKGDINRQEVYLAQAQLLSEEYHLNENLRNIYSARSKNAQKMDNCKSALDYARKSDSISRLIPNQLLSEKSVQIEMEKRLDDLKRKRALAQQNLVFQQRIGLISFVFAIFVLGGFIWIFSLFQKNKSKTKILLKQNLELVNQILPPKTTQVEEKEIDVDLIQKLEDYVVSKEAFKQNGLNLEKIAKKLGTNRTYLSEAINVYYAMNFNSWLNEIRIHEARKIFAQEKYEHYSIEGVAKEVGFASISVFNSAFKRVTGLTPSQFRSGVVKK